MDGRPPVITKNIYSRAARPFIFFVNNLCFVVSCLVKYSFWCLWYCNWSKNNFKKRCYLDRLAMTDYQKRICYFYDPDVGNFHFGMACNPYFNDVQWHHLLRTHCLLDAVSVLLYIDNGWYQYLFKWGREECSHVSSVRRTFDKHEKSRAASIAGSLVAQQHKIYNRHKHIRQYVIYTQRECVIAAKINNKWQQLSGNWHMNKIGSKVKRNWQYREFYNVVNAKNDSSDGRLNSTVRSNQNAECISSW